MIYAGNSVVVEPNTVIFMHMILLDWDHNPGHGFFGDTVVVTPAGCETLSQMASSQGSSFQEVPEGSLPPFERGWRRFSVCTSEVDSGLGQLPEFRP